MPNEYFELDAPLTRHTLGRAEQVNGIFQSVEAGFDKLADPEVINQGRITYVADTGAADAYVVALPTAPSSYTAGLSLTMKAANSNTGASTVNVNSLGVKSIKRFDGNNLLANDIVAGMLVHIAYDGTNFRIVGVHGSSQTSADASAAAAAASAAAASTSASTASTAATNAQTHYNNFRGTYYGALASDPALDPLGNAVGAGDWYFNTTTDQSRIYDGAAWADVGSSANLNTFIYTATGGETSLSGADDDGRVLAYTAGFLQVHRNGALLTPGDDYTATNGSTITGLAALSASDVVVIDAFTPFSAADVVLAADLASTDAGKGASMVSYEDGVTVQERLPVDTLADLQAASALEVAGLAIYMKGRSAIGDGGQGLFIWNSGDKSTEVGADEVTSSQGNGGIWIAPASDKTGASGAWKRNQISPIDPRWYGAVAGTSTDSLAAIQKAITTANLRGGRCYVDGGGELYRITDELFIKTNAVLVNCTIDFAPTANDKIAVNIARQDGSELVRVGGCENVVVTTTSTQTGLVGFNFGHLARACFINTCRAIMNNGPEADDREHIGFSIYGVRADLATSTGAYQNTMLQCSAYDCKTGYRLDTAGYGDPGYAPEANGNKIIACSAYSCLTRAVYIGEGAQDNHVQVRADTFYDSTGLGTTVTVAEIRGSYNRVELDEEIGTRGDTQYTVSFEGDNPRYNLVEYLTQNTVTAVVNDATTGSAVGKNRALDKVNKNLPDGGDLFAVSGYHSVSANTNEVYNAAVLPGPCQLINVVATNGSTPASHTRLYFAKNGSTDTEQRLTWGSGDAAQTLKEKVTDITSAGTIDSRYLYAKGDRVVVSIDQDSSAGQQVYYTMFFRMLTR